jgi:hypothetical protein
MLDLKMINAHGFPPSAYAIVAERGFTESDMDVV